MTVYELHTHLSLVLKQMLVTRIQASSDRDRRQAGYAERRHASMRTGG